MLMGFGRQSLFSVGTNVEVSADGAPECKIGGATLDWATFAALGADTTYNDGVTVKAGEKAARYGQVINRITSTANGGTVGMYGPFDPAATDGRQTLGDDTYVINRTVLAAEPVDQYPQAIFGGRVWLDRILQSGVGAASLAAGPTLAALRAALPRLKFVTGN
jgi:hypothetical protein